MSGTDDVLVRVTAAGRGQAEIELVVGRKVVEVDVVRIASAEARAELVKLWVTKWPGLDAAVIDAMLVEEAARLAADKRNAEEAERSANSTRATSAADTAALLAARDAETERLLASTPPNVRRAAEDLLAMPELLEQVAKDIASAGVAGEADLALAIYMIGTSRKLRRPLGGIVQGESSSGKSHTIECVASLFPEEELFRAHDISPNALYYTERGRLMHTWVVAGEKARPRKDEDERAEATRALREMLTSGHLKKAVPFKKDGGIATVEIDQPGPIAFVESTTMVELFDEDQNRCLLLATDETAQQTAIVLTHLGQVAAGLAFVDEHIRAVHQCAQRLLRRVKVLIPFAPDLAEKTPHKTQARRALRHAFSMIEAVALLRQRQRLVVGGGQLEHGSTIEATIDDYRVARALLLGPLGRALGGGLAETAIRFGQWIAATFPGAWTVADALRRPDCPAGKSTVHGYVKVLADAGYLQLVEEGRGNRGHRWKLSSQPEQVGATWLPVLGDDPHTNSSRPSDARTQPDNPGSSRETASDESAGRTSDTPNTPGGSVRASDSCSEAGPDEKAQQPSGREGCVRESGACDTDIELACLLADARIAWSDAPERTAWLAWLADCYRERVDYGDAPADVAATLLQDYVQFYAGPGPAACRDCGGNEWWRGHAGQPVCRRCHPPSPGAEVAGPAPDA